MDQPYWAGTLSAVFYLKNMKILSLFVDESGTFNVYAKHIPFYIVSIVFHNQQNDINKEIVNLNNGLKVYGISDNLVHTEPLIRNEGEYKKITDNDRRGILSKFNFFIKYANINYKTFVFEKSKYIDNYKLEAQMIKDIDSFFDNKTIFFSKFDKIILYYDNGQVELSKILNHTMALHFTNYEIRKINPKDYKLFQAADFACSIELIAKKIETKPLSRSENIIFKSLKAFKKDF